MTTSTCWPRIGPAKYRTTTLEDQVRREANTQVDEHLKASAQVVESAPRTLSRWRHGFKSRWDYAGQRPCSGVPMADGPASAPRRTRGGHGSAVPGRPLNEPV